MYFGLWTKHYDIFDIGVELLKTILLRTLSRLYDKIRLLRFFIGCGNARIVLDDARPGFFVVALHIARFADFQGAADIDFRKVFFSHNIFDNLPHGDGGGDKGRQADDARIEEEATHFTDASDVLGSIRRAEAKVTTEAMAHVVSVKGIGQAAILIETMQQGIGKGRLTCAGEAREPEEMWPLAKQVLAHGLAYRGVRQGKVSVICHGTISAISLYRYFFSNCKSSLFCFTSVAKRCSV